MDDAEEGGLPTHAVVGMTNIPVAEICVRFACSAIARNSKNTAGQAGSGTHATILIRSSLDETRQKFRKSA